MQPLTVRQKNASPLQLAIYAVIALTLALLLTTYFFPYAWVFSRYQTYDNFTVQRSEVDYQFTQILSYLAPPWQTKLDSDFFSPEDIAHMRDVLGIYQLLWLVLVVAIGTNLITRRLRTAQADQPPKRNTFAPKLGLALLILFTLIFWDQVFVAMHRILFPYNDYWMLDPVTSNLIKYFPDGVFQEIFAVWMGIALLIYLIVSANIVEQEITAVDLLKSKGG